MNRLRSTKSEHFQYRKSSEPKEKWYKNTWLSKFMTRLRFNRKKSRESIILPNRSSSIVDQTPNFMQQNQSFVVIEPPPAKFKQPEIDYRNMLPPLNLIEDKSDYKLYSFPPIKDACKIKDEWNGFLKYSSDSSIHSDSCPRRVRSTMELGGCVDQSTSLQRTITFKSSNSGTVKRTTSISSKVPISPKPIEIFNLSNMSVQNLISNSPVSTKVEFGMINGNSVPISGTLYDLVEYAIQEPLSTFAYVLLLTYQEYASSIELMHCIHKLYVKLQMTEGTVLDNESKLLKHRLASFAKRWLEMHPFEFQDLDLLTRFKTFLGTVSAAVDDEYTQNLLDSIHKDKADQYSVFSYASTDLDFDILSYSADVIAKHITLIDYALFAQITNEDIVALFNGNSDPDSSAREFIERCNSIGFWVSTLICSEINPRARVRTVEKLIDVAKVCFDLQNFSGCMAIIAGLNTYPVVRLKKTFDRLSSSSKLLLSDMESVFDFHKNFCLYRKVQMEAEPPLVPFLGVLTKDLAAIKETTPDFLPGNFINFERSWKIYDQLLAFQTFKASPYHFPELDEFTKDTINLSHTSFFGMSNYCKHLPSDCERDLDIKSKQIEPLALEEENMGVLSSLLKHMGESVQLTMLKIHESQGKDPIERVKRSRRFRRTSSVAFLKNKIENASTYFLENASQLFHPRKSRLYSHNEESIH